MSKQPTVITKKRKGPAPTGKGHLIGVRLQPEQLAALDGWIERHDDPKPSRPEAIRQALAGALGGNMASTTLPGLVTGRDII